MSTSHLYAQYTSTAGRGFFNSWYNESFRVFVRVNYIYPYIFKCFLLRWTVVVRFVLFFACNKMRLFIVFQVGAEAVNEITPAVYSTPVPHECIMIHCHAVCLVFSLSTSLWIHLAVSSLALQQECISSIKKITVCNICIFHSHLQNVCPVMLVDGAYSNVSLSLGSTSEYWTWWPLILHILHAPLFNTHNSGHRTSANELISRIMFVWEARHKQCGELGVLQSVCYWTDSASVWK